MRIAIVCDVLGKENNGTTIATMNLINTLKAKGHEVRVVCPDKDREGQEGYYVVPTISFGKALNKYVDKNGVSIAKADKDVLYKAFEGIDAMHVMTPFSVGKAAALIAKEKGIPLSAGFHCQAENLTNHLFMMNASLANKVTYKAFYKRLYRYCDAVHYPSQFICDTFEQAIKKKTNHYVISNGVNKMFKQGEAIKPKELEDKYVILFTGRYSKEKSHSVLIDAVAKSAHKDRIQLIFAGSGPLAERITEQSINRGIQMPIMKFFTRSELLNVIRYSDLYVHPAEIEIEAIACLEAIACGKVPIISNSPRSATRYFALTPNNLFKCNDSKDLAEKIDYWLDHPEEKKACSEKYLGYAEQFDFDTCMNRMEEMIKDIVNKKKN